MSESTKHQHCGISGQLMLVILLFLLQTVEIYSSSTPTLLTATDAYPVLGGYVVPVNGFITLHCEAQGPDYDDYTGLQWNIAMGAYSWKRADIAVIALRSDRFTALSIVNNPSILHVHNLLQSENGSTVQCLISNHPPAKWSQIVTIYVEDTPNCVEHLNTSSTDDLYIVTWNSYDGLLPVIYNISIWSVNDKVIISKSTIHPMLHLNESTYSLQSSTTYFVLVTTCNSFGCSQDCGHNTLYTGDLHATVPVSNPTKGDDNSTSLSAGALAIIITPIAAALLIIFILVALISSCIFYYRMSNSSGVYQTSTAQLNYYAHVSKSGMQETDNVSHPSIDVTGVVMEENPSYGDLEELRTERNGPDVLLRTKDLEEVQRNPAY